MKRQWSVLSAYPDFRRLFVGSSVSLLGSSVTTVALPLTAVVLLHASAAQMGILGAVAYLPNLVLGLPAGVWVGRLPYRRLLVSTDLAQMFLIGAIPVLDAVHLLRIWQLYLVVILAGVCALFDAVAAQSFTPLLVPRANLLAANSALALSTSTVSTTGTALGSALVELLTAPIAIAADAISFLLSALCRARISAAGSPVPPTDQQRRRLIREIFEGLRTVAAHSIVRAVTVSAALGALAGQMQSVVLVLFLVRTLHLSPALVGLMMTVTGAAGVLGALISVPTTARIGHGPAFITGMVLASVAGLVMAAASGPTFAIVITVVVAQALRGWGPALYGVNQQTIRQTFIPADLMSRAQATWRFLVYGTQAVGALLGGLVASAVGLRATLIISSAGMFAGTVTASASQLRTLHRLPAHPDARTQPANTA